MGKIFCFMGKSSCGKDTIFKIISNDFNDFIKIVPYTTRPIREGEIDGVTYHFIDDKTYLEMLNNNLIIESRSYNTKNGIWTYFTSSMNMDLENNNYMNINTLSGYESLRNYFGKDKVIPIYIEVENGIRLERALARETKEKDPKYKEMCRRFLADQEDFSEDNLRKCGISTRFYNDDLLECIMQIENKIIETLEQEKQCQKIIKPR